jgi:hypothetical protein
MSGSITVYKTSGSLFAGGLVGYSGANGAAVNINNSTAKGVDATGKIEISVTTATVYAGGIAGYWCSYINEGVTSSKKLIITGPTNNNSTTGTKYVGGIVGQAPNTSPITGAQLEANGSITIGTTTGAVYAGGILGSGYAVITGNGNPAISDSAAPITVTAGAGSSAIAVGGILGNGSSTITGSRSTGVITVESANTSSSAVSGTMVGGVAGYLNYYSSSATGSITGSSHATGAIKVTQTDSGQACVGGLVGYMATSTSVTDSTNGAPVTLTRTAASYNSFTGGLVGYGGGGSITGSTVTTAGSVTVTGPSGGKYSGGLIGYTADSFSIAASHAAGKVTVTASSSGTIYTGGLVGYGYGSSSYRLTVSNSYATGQVETKSTYNGSQTQYTGGLIGHLSWEGVISNSYATGNVSALNEQESSSGDMYAGGFAGWISSCNITDSYATGNVSAKKTGTSSTGDIDVGGFAGELYDRAIVSGGRSSDGVTAAGNVTLVSNGNGYPQAGGFAGQVVWNSTMVSQLTNIKATGNVSYTGGRKTTGDAFNSAGGLVGHSQGYTASYMHTYTGCSATGNVTADFDTTLGNNDSGGSAAGGLIGSAQYTSVTNSYAAGNLAITKNDAGWISAGGLIGRVTNSSAVSRCYAAGTVSVTQKGTSVSGIGGIAGVWHTDAGSLIDSYSLGDVFYANTNAALTQNPFIGGIVGYIKSSTSTLRIYRVYAAGSIRVQNASATGYNYVGGLTGYGTVESSLYMGKQVILETPGNKTNLHKLAGYATAGSNNRSWEGSVVKYSNAVGDTTYTEIVDTTNNVSSTGTPTANALLQSLSAYTENGWSTDIWEIGPPSWPYPILKWQNGTVVVPPGLTIPVSDSGSGLATLSGTLTGTPNYVLGAAGANPITVEARQGSVVKGSGLLQANNTWSITGLPITDFTDTAASTFDIRLSWNAKAYPAASSYATYTSTILTYRATSLNITGIALNITQANSGSTKSLDANEPASWVNPQVLALPSSGSTYAYDGNFHRPGDVDYYSFTLTTATTVKMLLNGYNGTDDADHVFDVYLHLLDSNYNVVVYNDDGGSGTTLGAGTGNYRAAYISQSLAAGTYIIVCRPYTQSNTGDYWLRVQR